MKVDLSGQTQRDGFGVNVFSVSTNDFSLVNSFNPVASNSGHEADQAEVSFTAPTSGLMPLLVSDCDHVGTYSFVAYVAHRLTAYLSSPYQDRGHHKTYFWVRASDGNGHGAPLGLNVGVQGRDSHGHWTWWNWTAWKAYNFYVTWPRAMRRRRRPRQERTRAIECS